MNIILSFYGLASHGQTLDLMADKITPHLHRYTPPPKPPPPLQVPRNSPLRFVTSCPSWVCHVNNLEIVLDVGVRMRYSP